MPRGFFFLNSETVAEHQKSLLSPVRACAWKTAPAIPADATDDLRADFAFGLQRMRDCRRPRYPRWTRGVQVLMTTEPRCFNRAGKLKQ